MDSSEISNGDDWGVYVRKSTYYNSKVHCLIKNSNITHLQHPLYIESSDVSVTFSRLYDNVCDDSNCAIMKVYAETIIIHANLVKSNSASQIIFLERSYYSGDNFEVSACFALHVVILCISHYYSLLFRKLGGRHW